MLGLRWGDIDLERTNEEIHITRQVVHPRRNLPQLGPPKTAAGVRCIPISPLLLNTLGPLKQYGYIVSGDQPFSYTELRRRQDHFKEVFNLPAGITLYNLRTTRLTEMAEAGTPIDYLALFAGHSDVKTTRKYYLHIREKGMSVLGDAVRSTDAKKLQ